jgi:hypothetical protein
MKPPKGAAGMIAEEEGSFHLGKMPVENSWSGVPPTRVFLENIANTGVTEKRVKRVTKE